MLSSKAICLLSAAAAACFWGAGARADAPVPSPVVQAESRQIILDVLTNFKENGFNNDKTINNGLGGLFINWRYGTRPLMVNMNGTGKPDAPDVKRHDVLTDFRYLYNLWNFKRRYPADHRFDDELAKMTPIVKADFAHTTNDRGWLYDEFIGLYHLSGDTDYKQIARDLATHFYKDLYHEKIGTIYKTGGSQTHGASCRIDWLIETGCALQMAGKEFNQPQWTQAGKKTIAYAYQHAYVPEYHVFLKQLDTMILPNGSANPNPTIFRALVGHTNVEGGLVRLGEVSQEALSFLHAYQVTGDAALLDHAKDTLLPMTAKENLCGLWDSENKGYFSEFVFPGPDSKHIGTPRLKRGFKEAGRQLQMLRTFRIANVITNGQYQEMQDALMDVALHKAYYKPGKGYLYEQTGDWKVLVQKSGQNEDWVTTEAMGAALQAIFVVLDPKPW